MSLCLMKHCFEPLTISSLLDLSMKIAFLVTNTSARRVGELGALMAETTFPHLQCSSRKRSCCDHILSFYLKCWLNFILSTRSFISCFVSPPRAPKLHQTRKEAAFHTPDVRRYLDRTKPFRKCPPLLCQLQKDPKDPQSPPRLPRWISECIISCYDSTCSLLVEF